jgi:glycosyltransferase involved in cell wall biosynthesis
VRLLFILPGGGGGGGAHSVVQEAAGLTRLGAEVALALSQDRAEIFRWHYPELADARIALHEFADIAQLAALLPGFDIACATSAPSAHMLSDAMAVGGADVARPAYYVQDYEPLIFTPGTRKWEDSRASYTMLDAPLMFAKTDWLRRVVNDNHGREVGKVSASIDHATYRALARAPDDVLTLSAMIRPKTPRRGPRRTIRILQALAAAHGGRIRIVTFGCQDEDIVVMGARLPRGVDHRGVLRRDEVAAVLQASDIFLDLSDYQAFGRTGLEAMACGCVPLMPVFGGAGEFARHWDNALVVDTRSDAAILEATNAFLAADPAVRARMRDHAIATASDYTVEKAALSEYQAFSTYLARAS